MFLCSEQRRSKLCSVRPFSGLRIICAEIWLCQRIALQGIRQDQVPPQALAVVEGAKKGPWVGRVKKDVAVCDELDTGRMEMKMTWDKTCPDVAELTFTRNGKKETFNGIPLTFLRWWAFGRGERSW